MKDGKKHWYFNGSYFLENIIKEKTFKKFYNNFYIIPKNEQYTKKELKILEELKLDLDDNEFEDIYIVRKGVKKRKLSEEKVNEVKGLLQESDCTQTEIARKFNVSKATITKIKQGKYYK